MDFPFVVPRVSAAAQRATVRWDPALTQPSELIAAFLLAKLSGVHLLAL